MTQWQAIESSDTKHSGSEGGKIIFDEEHKYGARITLEENCSYSPYAITCGVYGLMVHTRFFESKEQAEAELVPMKSELEKIVRSFSSPASENQNVDYDQAANFCENFINKFPT